MTFLESILALNLLPGIGPIRVRRLIQHFGGAEGVLRAPQNKLTAVSGIGSEIASMIASWEDHVDLQGELASIKSRGITLLTPEDSAWPPPFHHLPDAPLLLYVWGNVLESDSRSLAVVGSRKTTHYGRDCTHKLSFQLAHMGLTIISGLARGIDTAAHEGALAAEGRTIAVLGSGLGQLYPPENMALAERIADGNGAVVSEFPINTSPTRYTFPQRNRIVAGWCEGILVVECAKRSGALITANLAAEYGKHIFAVPGGIDRPSSEGCNALIRTGAILVTEGSQIIDELPPLAPESRTRAPLHDPDSASENLRLSESESLVLATLSKEERTMDQIIEDAELEASVVAATLLRLEMRGLAVQLPGSHFVQSS